MIIYYGADYETSGIATVLIMFDLAIRKLVRTTLLIWNLMNNPEIINDPISKISCPEDNLVIFMSSKVADNNY